MMLHCFSPVMEIEPAYRLANKPVMMITNAIAMRRWGRVITELVVQIFSRFQMPPHHSSLLANSPLLSSHE